MTEVRSVPYTQVHQPKLQTKQLVNWTSTDLWMLLDSALIFVALYTFCAVYHLGYLLVLFAFLVLVGLNARIPKGYGRTYKEIATLFRSGYLESVMQGVIWRQADPSNALMQWARYHGANRRGYAALPLGFGMVKAVLEGTTYRYGLLRQLDRPYDHLYITARGGAFSSLDITSQTAANDELATICNQVLAQSDLKAGISLLRITGPFNQSTLSGYLRENLNPVVALADNFVLDEDTKAWVELTARNLSQLRPTAASFGGAKVWPLIVITIRRSRKSWRQAMKGKASAEDLFDIPIIELGRELEQSLENANLLELTDVRCLGLAELAEVVRASWDTVGIQEWYKLRAEGQIPRNDDEIEQILAQYADIDEGLDAVDRALRAWPEHEVRIPEGHTDMLAMDGNYITVLRVTGLPEYVRSDQFLSLHYRNLLSQWSRFAVVGQGVSGKAETNHLIFGQSASANIESAFFSNRVVPHPKFRNKQRQLSQQAQEMSMMGVGQHFNILVPVVAESASTAKRSAKKMRALLTAQGFSCEIVPLSARQVDACISGILGANRL